MATGRQQVFVTLRYSDAPAAIEWLKTTLGFVEHEIHVNADGTIDHAQLAFGNDIIMLGSAEVPSAPVTVYLAHPDVDGHYAAAVAAGADVTSPITDQPYGSREYSVIDPEGNTWAVGSYRPVVTGHTELVATVLGAPDPQSLAEFYRQLLGWQITSRSPEWMRLVGPEGGASLSFQLESDFERPVWPQVEGEQQMMMHLDIGVEDLRSGVAFAESLGATLADFQPQENVRVMLDPAGHPFCLFAG